MRRLLTIVFLLLLAPVGAFGQSNGAVSYYVNSGTTLPTKCNADPTKGPIDIFVLRSGGVNTGKICGDANNNWKDIAVAAGVTSWNGRTGVVTVNSGDIATVLGFTPANAATLAAHTSDTNNPHSVTKEQIGLGNVQNVDATNASNIAAGTVDKDRLPGTLNATAAPSFTGTLYGGAAANDDVTIEGTSHGTKGSAYVFLSPSGAGVSVGCGSTVPATMFVVCDTATSSPRGILDWQSNAGTDGARLHLRKSRGTHASPSTVVSGDTIGRIVGSAYDSASFLEMASMSFEAEGTIAATRVPTRIVLSTATDEGPSVLTERLRIDSSGAHTVTSAAAAAFAVGPNGNTNPSLRIVSNVAGAATGLSVKGNAAGAGVTLTALSSGSNEDILVNGKGTGSFKWNTNALTINSAGALTVNATGQAINATGGSIFAAGGFQVGSANQVTFSNGSNFSAGFARSSSGSDHLKVTNGAAGALPLEAAGFAQAITAAKTADYTLTSADGTVINNSTAGSFANTLPAANAVTAGRLFRIFNYGSANQVNVNRAGSDTIVHDTTTGATTYALGSGKWMEIQADGTSTWYVVGHN